MSAKKPEKKVSKPKVKASKPAKAKEVESKTSDAAAKKEAVENVRTALEAFYHCMRDAAEHQFKELNRIFAIAVGISDVSEVLCPIDHLMYDKSLAVEAVTLMIEKTMPCAMIVAMQTFRPPEGMTDDEIDKRYGDSLTTKDSKGREIAKAGVREFVAVYGTSALGDKTTWFSEVKRNGEKAEMGEWVEKDMTNSKGRFVFEVPKREIVLHRKPKITDFGNQN